MRNLATTLATFLLAGNAMAFDSGIDLSHLELSGDCEYDDITIVEENGETWIAAYLDSMAAFTEGGIDRKRCTMNYQVDLPYGHKLDFFQFSVDGTYQVADTGAARLTVSHRVLNGKSVRTTKFFKGNGHFRDADINDFTGDITYFDLERKYQRCGAEIPLETSVHMHVTQSTNDHGYTALVLDEGVTSGDSNPGYIKFCKIKILPCL